MYRSCPRIAAFTTPLLLAAISASGETADYRLTFDATWSDATVTGEHFSGMVGGTHDASVSFWSVGELATTGVERMAESGQKSWLIAEVEDQIDAGGAGAVICGATFSSPGSRTLEFTVTDEYPLVTVVSMIAPSPDWFVGVSGLSLQDGDGWVTALTVDLYPYDAGTDSGAYFDSPNADTNPAEPIFEITDGSLFDPLVTGTFTFQRLTDCNDNGQFDVDEIAADPGLDFDGDGTLDECQCIGDLDGDGVLVGTADLLTLLANWGTNGTGATLAAPLDTVDVADLLVLLARWGSCG